VAGDDGPIVLRIPDEVMEKLAGLEEEAIERVGEELAATEEFEINGWPAEEVQSLVEELSELARLADSQGQALFVWMHPLLT
jgi:DNA-directed RNA polymerase subunit F